MKTLFYSAKDFEKSYLHEANADRHAITLIPEALSDATVSLAKGYEAVSIFAGDDASTTVIEKLNQQGIKYIAIRAAGYDNVDIQTANQSHIRIANVPEYSPNAIAEHAIALILALNRKLVMANEQVHHQIFQ